jgi:hypothetical protein
MAKNSIGLAIATEEYRAKFFANGAAPGGVLEHPSTIKDPQKLKDSWNAVFQGSGNSHRIAVIEEGLKYQPIGISPEQAQFLETRKFQINEIARIFRVPPHMVGDLEKSSFSNSDEGTYGKVCVSCKEPAETLYVTLPPHKWWLFPRNKTLYVTVPDGTTSLALSVFANELSSLIAISGRVESYVGIFTRQLIVGDRIELVDENQKHSIIGTATSVRHRFGRGGFITEFAVDSSGRKGKVLLQDYVAKLGSGGSEKQNNVVIS